MAGLKAPRVVLVTRPTPYELLLARHGTLGQARFFLERRGQSLELLQAQHAEQQAAENAVERAIPTDWRRGRATRADLDRFLFEPDDLIVAVGQDGLVANVAKYLRGQPVIGINPSPERYPGILVPHPPAAAADLLHDAAAGRAGLEARAMVEARLDDGQRLLALNEIFLGHQTHQSARYRLQWTGREERQSSSGLIIASGTGASGWARSIHSALRSPLALPAPTEPALAFFVREAWPSISTGASLTEGRLAAGENLVAISEMDDGGVAFGDGIEADRIEWRWGQRLEIGLAEVQLLLVVNA